MGEKWTLFGDGLGCAIDGGRGWTRFSPSELTAKSEPRAKRTSDLERRNGVGGVLGGFWGEVFAVEGTVVVLVDERCEFC